MERKVSMVLVLVLLSTVTSVRAQFRDIEASQRVVACIQNDHAIQAQLEQCYIQKMATAGVSDPNENPVISAIDKGCAMVDPMSCLSEHVLKQSNKCLTKEQADELQKALDVISAGYRYACDEGGARLKEFFSTQCMVKMGEKKEDIVKCMGEATKGVEEELKEVKEDKEKSEEIGCKTLLKMKDCLINNMDCDDKPEELVEGLIQAMVKETPCWKVFSSSGRSILKHEMYFATVITTLVLTCLY